MNTSLFEFKQLKAFVAVVELGSFSAAASAIDQTQSSISQLVQRLEQEVGCQLLDRSKRPISPTISGHEFYTEAQKILLDAKNLQERMRASAGRTVSRLRVGMVDSILTLCGVELLEYLANQADQINQTTGTAPELIHALETDRLDLVITVASGDIPQKLDIYPVVSEPFVLVTPSDWPELTLQELCEQKRFIQYENWTATGSQTSQWLKWRKLRVNSLFSVARAETVLDLVGKGYGWSLATPSFLAFSSQPFDRLSCAPLPRPGINRDIAVIGKRGELSGLLPQLAQVIQDEIFPTKTQVATARWPWLF